MSMMKNQKWSAPHRGMPTEDIGGSSARVSVSSETVQLYFNDAGVRTADAAEPMGTVVEGIFNHAPIANESGDQVGRKGASSLSFPPTEFNNEIELSYEDLESLDNLSFVERLSKVQTLVQAVKTAQANGVTTTMADGDYVVDYRKGWFIGKKFTGADFTIVASYKTLAKNTGVTSIIPGTGATNLGKAIGDAAASGDVGVAGLARRQDTPAALEADGDWVPQTVEGAKGTRTTLGSLISGEDQSRNVMHVVNGGATTRITTATTTVCRNTSGKMNGVLVEVALTGTATFYDNASAASGTVILILPIGTPAGYYSFCDGGTVSNGVVCVTSAADRLVVGCSR